MKAFLSSTFKDLEQHRAAVIARLRRLDGVEVRCMEDFGARSDWPKEFCLREARECDVFIGVTGHLYGFVPAGDDTSITEQEYRAAEEAGREMLIFVAPEDFPVPFKLTREDSDPERQQAFREHLLSRHVVDLEWASPETLASRVDTAVHNWRLARGGPAAVAAMPGIDLVTYAERCRKRWEVVDLSTLAAPGALDGDVELPRLSQVFIPQACRRSRPAVSLPRDYLEKQGLDPEAEERLLAELRERWQAQERLPALELLSRSDARKLVLLGDPGAGKSSLTRYVLLKLLEPLPPPGDGDGWRRPLEGTWPVLVELRDLLAREAEGRCEDLLDYLAYTGETQGFGFDRAALEAQLRDRPSLIIVDGLDEIFSLQRRRAMVEEIVGLESRFPQARVLVTSRIAGFDARPFESAGYALATLDDLDKDQVRLFTDTWFGLAFPGEPDKAERARNDLLEALERRPQLAVLAGNPLILTIMAIIARHKRLARSRTQLYAQALEVLCYAWDYRRGLKLEKDSPLEDLQPDDTLLMLRRIAWRMQESEDGVRANAISENDLRSILFEFFVRDWHFPPPRAGRAVAEMVTLLQERNWILTIRGPELYGFVHRTFLEYLVALELTKRFEAQDLTIEELRDEHVLPRVDDDSYAEVILLLCGQLPARAADQLVYAITPSPERSVEQEERLLLAWQALGELDPRSLASAGAACDAALRGLYAWVHERELGGVFGILDKIVEALTVIEPDTWPVVVSNDNKFPVLYARHILLSRSVNDALVNVVWAPDENLRERLLSLLESPRGSDREQSGQLIPTDRNTSVRTEAIHLLAQQFAHSPKSFDCVRGLVARDEDEVVRVAATYATAREFAEHAETFSLLCTWAAESDSENVRIAAIQGLAESFSERSETFALLSEWAATDDTESVRGAAIRGLGENLSQQVEVFVLLRMWAAEEDSVTVRSTAVQGLGWYFAERPETMKIMEELACGDASEEVREWAMYFWSRTLESLLLRRLLTRDLDDLTPGIDLHDPIDSTRIIVAAENLNEDPDTIRQEYERLVREHGFPLRLSWLEDDGEGESPPNPD